MGGIGAGPPRERVQIESDLPVIEPAEYAEDLPADEILRRETEAGYIAPLPNNSTMGDRLAMMFKNELWGKPRVSMQELDNNTFAMWSDPHFIAERIRGAHAFEQQVKGNADEKGTVTDLIRSSREFYAQQQAPIKARRAQILAEMFDPHTAASIVHLEDINPVAAGLAIGAALRAALTGGDAYTAVEALAAPIRMVQARKDAERKVRQAGLEAEFESLGGDLEFSHKRQLAEEDDLRQYGLSTQLEEMRGNKAAEDRLGRIQLQMGQLFASGDTARIPALLDFYESQGIEIPPSMRSAAQVATAGEGAKVASTAKDVAATAEIVERTQFLVDSHGKRLEKLGYDAASAQLAMKKLAVELRYLPADLATKIADRRVGMLERRARIRHLNEEIASSKFKRSPAGLAAARKEVGELTDKQRIDEAQDIDWRLLAYNDLLAEHVRRWRAAGSRKPSDDPDSKWTSADEKRTVELEGLIEELEAQKRELPAPRGSRGN